MLRDAVNGAVVHVLDGYLRPLPEHAWQKVQAAHQGNLSAANALLRRLESLQVTLGALVVVLDLAELLEAALLDRLVPDPQAPPFFQEHTTTVTPGHCALVACQQPLPLHSGPGRPQRYCSARCREQAHLRRKILLAATRAGNRIVANLLEEKKQLLSDAKRFTEHMRTLRSRLALLNDTLPLQLGESIHSSLTTITAMLQETTVVDELRQWLSALNSCIATELKAQIDHDAQQNPFAHLPRDEASGVIDSLYSSSTSTQRAELSSPIEAWASGHVHGRGVLSRAVAGLEEVLAERRPPCDPY